MHTKSGERSRFQTQMCHTQQDYKIKYENIHRNIATQPKHGLKPRTSSWESMTSGWRTNDGEIHPSFPPQPPKMMGDTYATRLDAFHLNAFPLESRLCLEVYSRASCLLASSYSASFRFCKRLVSFPAPALFAFVGRSDHMQTE